VGVLALSLPAIGHAAGLVVGNEITVTGQRRTCTGLSPLYPGLPGRGDTFAVSVFNYGEIIILYWCIVKC